MNINSDLGKVSSAAAGRKKKSFENKILVSYVVPFFVIEEMQLAKVKLKNKDPGSSYLA